MTICRLYYMNKTRHVKILIGLFVLFLVPAAFGQNLPGLQITVQENNGELTIVSSRGTVNELVIPGIINNMPVTAIGEGAFTRRGLTKVIIPDSVKVIGDYAFSFNELTTLVIGNNVVSIGQRAFFSNKIEALTLGESVSDIGMGAFAENNLSEISFPESVTHIGAYAFFFNKIRILDLPGSVTFLGEGSFSTNRLHTLVLNNGTEEIGDGAFYNNQLTSITIPASINELGKKVFDSRNTLKSSQPPVNYIDEKGEILFTTANNFDTYYTFNGKRPGKYIFTRTGWTFEE